MTPIREETFNDVLDKILERHVQYLRAGHEHLLKEQLKEAIDKHLIGRQKPYRGGNFSYYEGQKFLRRKLRSVLFNKEDPLTKREDK